MPKISKSNRKRTLNINIESLSTEDLELSPNIKMRSLQIRRAEALEELNGTNIPSEFRFRETEMGQISAFIDESVGQRKAAHRILMITGPPGAGKTLSANSVLAKKQVKVIKVNANIVKTIRELQQVLCDELLDIKEELPTLQILRALQNANLRPCILYIEEIETLFKSQTNHFSEDFLSLFCSKHTKLILIGVSNTIDALQRYGEKFSIDISKIQNIVFKPYSSKMISGILREKLERVLIKTGIRLNFSQQLLIYSCHKLESQKKGDLRIALEFMKELLQQTLEENKQGAEFDITIEAVNHIFAKMGSCKDMLICSLPFQQQLMLLALFTHLKKTDALTVVLKDLVNDLKWICSSLQITFSKKFLDDGLPELEQYCLVETKKKNNETRIVLKVSLNEIQASFQQHPLFGKFFTHDS